MYHDASYSDLCGERSNRDVGEQFVSRAERYTYYDEDSGGSADQESSSEVFGKALINSLIIIGAVIAMTFFIVGLFYFRCYKTLAGFIMFTTVVALGYNFAFILMAAIDKYSITIDWITFLFILYNFAVVGVIAIFYQKGTPSYIGQGYLVIVSLTIAYLLSFLPEWTGWYARAIFQISIFHDYSTH